MAKRGAAGSRTRRSGDRLGQAAEDLGAFFGTVARRVESWVGERDRLAKQLKQIQGTAGDLLGKLGSGGLSDPFGRGRKRRAAAGNSSATRGGRRRRRVSAATRARMSRAQRARRAKEGKSKRGQ
jgi:hypothetical protein